MSNRKKGDGMSSEFKDLLVRRMSGLETKQAEIIAKHNELAAQIGSIEELFGKLTAAITGQFGNLEAYTQGNFDRIGRSLGGMDMNILSLAEVVKEVYGHMSQFSTLLTRTGADLKIEEEEMGTIKEAALQWYQNNVASAFRKVRKDMEEADKAAQAEQEKAKKEAEEASKAKTEAETIEQELRNAETVDRGISLTPVSGGGGAEFPPGAEIFGGP